jgi:hypothetical protein
VRQIGPCVWFARPRGTKPLNVRPPFREWRPVRSAK